MELDLSGKGGSILVPNRHFRDVLRAKGYEVGGHGKMKSKMGDSVIAFSLGGGP